MAACEVVIFSSTWNPNLNGGNVACNAGPSARRAGRQRRDPMQEIFWIYPPNPGCNRHHEEYETF